MSGSAGLSASHAKLETVLLQDVASTSLDVGATSSRLSKVAHIAELLQRAAGSAGVAAELVATIVSWLSGELRQRQIGVGWAALRSLPPPASDPALTVGEVDATFTEIGAVSGKGSQARRASLIAALVRRRDRNRADLSAAAAGRRAAPGRAGRDHGRRRGQGPPDYPAAAVQRAAMLGGDLPAVAAAAMTGASPGRVHPASGTSGRPDVGPDCDRRRRCARTPRRHNHFRGEAGWCAGADPPGRRTCHRLHPQSRRCDRPAARGGGSDVGIAGDAT